MDIQTTAIYETLYFITTKIRSSPREILFLYPNQKLEDGLPKYLQEVEINVSPKQTSRVFHSCYHHLTGKDRYIEFSPDSIDFLKLPSPPSGFYNTIEPYKLWHPEHPIHNPPKNEKGEWPTLSMRLKVSYYETPLPQHLTSIKTILQGYNVF